MMNKILLKEHPERLGHFCLYDTRSGGFFQGGTTRDPNSIILSIALSIVTKPLKKIIELAQAPVYIDGEGYVPHNLAKEYLRLNPDLIEKFKATQEKLSKPKINKKTQRVAKDKKKTKNESMNAKPLKKADKGQKQPIVKNDVVHKTEHAVEGSAPKKRGRPRKNPVVEIASSEPKRGRGRPRKNPI